MLILIILSSLIPGTLAVFQYLDQQKKDSQYKKNEALLNSKIESLRIDNKELRRQLIDTESNLNQAVIGAGDLDVEIRTIGDNQFIFRFVNNSELSVFDANIMVQDYSKIVNCDVVKENETEIHIKEDCYRGNFKKYSKITFNPGGAFIDKNARYLLTNDYMNFAIQVETRNQTVIYHITYKVIDDNLVRSIRKYNLLNNRKILVFERNALNLNTDYWRENFYEKILYTT